MQRIKTIMHEFFWYTVSRGERICADAFGLYDYRYRYIYLLHAS